MIPADWEKRFILNLHKGKGEDQCNYVMQLLEWVLDFYIHEMVNIDEMQFAFVPGRDNTDAIFIVRCLLGKYIEVHRH